MMPLAMIVMMILKCVNRWALALEWDLVLVLAWDLDPAPVLAWNLVLDLVLEWVLDLVPAPVRVLAPAHDPWVLM